MNYLVMECHPGYAVVLDNSGRFLKVANMGYQVGQTVSEITAMNTFLIPGVEKKKSLKKIFLSIASMAACLGLIAFGAWQFLAMPYGTVRMQINPDVRMTVNRIDHVIDIEGLNADGETLIEGYSYSRKNIEQVSDELADRASDMGYLNENGTIRITVESDHEKWKKATEDRLIIELEIHMGNSITVIPESSSKPSDETEITIPVDPSHQVSDNTISDDDDDNDRDDNDKTDDSGHQENDDNQDDDSDDDDTPNYDSTDDQNDENDENDDNDDNDQNDDSDDDDESDNSDDSDEDE